MKKIFAAPHSRNDSQAQKTGAFIQQLGTALCSENKSSGMTRQLVDGFIQQVEAKYPSAASRAAKYSRVVSKLQAQFTEVTPNQLALHAPALAQYRKTMPLLASEQVKEAKELADLIVKKAKSDSDTLINETNLRMSEANQEAAELQQAAQNIFSESISARTTAQENAAVILADAEKQGALLLRDAKAKIVSLEAQNTALQVYRKHAYSMSVEALRARSEHRFSAGGCTFHVSSEALEAHPESYLTLLVQADNHNLGTRKTKTGAYKVDDLTAEQLQAVCHYLNTGFAVGCLRKRDTLTQSILQRVCSGGSMVSVLDATEAAQQLDFEHVTSHCVDGLQVHELARALAETLARELPSQCTTGRQMKVVIHPTLPFRLNDGGTMAVEQMRPIFPAGEKTTAALQNAVIGTTRWLQKAGFNDPKFFAVADNNGYFEHLICTVHPPAGTAN